MKALIALLTLVCVLSFDAMPQDRESRPGRFFPQATSLTTADRLSEDGDKVLSVFSVSKQNTSGTKRSAGDFKQRLDSLIRCNWDVSSGLWISSRKKEFIYDAENNVSQEFEYKWIDSLSRFVRYYKTEYSYDEKGNTIEEIDFKWVDSSSYWRPFWKYEYNFDTLGNYAQEKEYYYDQNTSLFVLLWKIEYTYDLNGNLIQDLIFDRDDVSGELKEASKTEYTYDTDNKIVLVIDYFWDKSAGQYLADMKVEINYDERANITQEVLYYRDEISNCFEAVEMNEYACDTSGKRTNWVVYEWDSSDSLFIESTKSDYSYNNAGNIIEQNYYKWVDSTAYWLLNGKYESSYDDSGNMIRETFYQRNSEPLIFSYKFEYDYDLTCLQAEVLQPPMSWLVLDYADVIVNKPRESIHYNWDQTTQEWKFYKKSVVYYTEINASSLVDRQKGSIEIYPNPVVEKLQIQSKEHCGQIYFELYDVQGRKILSKEIHTAAGIDMTVFAPGLYFYKCQVDGKVQSGKIIKISN